MLNHVFVLRSSSSLPVLTLFTKDNCQLCEEAKWEIKEAGFQVGRDFRLAEVDIEAEGNERIRKKFRFDIPVFELDGKPLCKNRIDLKRLREELDKRDKC